MPAAKTFHVQTFVQYPREKTEDLVAHATLVNARDPDNDVEGDVSEAMLSQTDGFQCDGKGDGTNGCNELHERAVERVRSRLVGADGDVAVVWRRFHPLIAAAQATPGKPFEAVDDDGVRLRVEVREIVKSNDEQYEPLRVSTTSLQGMRAEFQNRQAAAQEKNQMRQAFSMFEDVQVAASEDQLEDYDKRFRFLPDQKKVQAAIEGVRKQIDKIVEAADEATLDALNTEPDEKDPANANGLRNLQAELQKSEAAMQKAFAPLQKIDAEAKELIDRQAEVRQQLDAIDAIVVGLEKRRDAGLGGLDVAALNDGKVRAALHELLEDATAGKKDAAQLAKALAPITKDVEGLRQDGERLVAAQEVLRTAFDARVARVEGWRKGDGAKEQLLAYVDSGVGYAGFASAHWRTQVEALGDKLAGLPKVGDCVYADAKDEKRLVEAEKALGPVAELEAQIDLDMARRMDGVRHTIEVNDQEIEAPTVWVTITKVHPGAEIVDVDVHVRNNDILPVAVGFRFGPEDQRDEVFLGGGGRHATVSYDEVNNGVQFFVTGVGNAGAEPGKRADLTRVEAVVEPMRLEGDGAVWHVPPADFRAAEKQPKKAGRLVLEKNEDGVEFDTMKIPGRD